MERVAPLMPTVLSALKEPAVFWLDAHYSGDTTALGPQETPVMEELRHVLAHGVTNHVVLIDDVRLFTGLQSWPRFEEITRLIGSQRPDWTVEVRDDIARAHRPTQPSQ